MSFMIRMFLKVVTTYLVIAFSIIFPSSQAMAVAESVEVRVPRAASLDDRLSPNYGLNRVCSSFLLNQRQCTSGSATARPTLALWGDSFSMHLVQALQNSGTKVRFIAQTRSICNPIIGLAPRNSAQGVVGATRCNNVNSEFLKYLLGRTARSSIKTVVLASHWENILLNGKTTMDTKGALSRDPNKPRTALGLTISKLQQAGYRVVVISSPAFSSADTGACLRSSINQRKSLARCNFPISSNISTNPNLLLESVSSGADKFINLAALMCPEGTCIASAGKILIYRDKYHLSREGSAYLGRKHDLVGQILR